MSIASKGLQIRGVSRTYPGGIAGIVGVDLEIDPGALLAVVGPSGSGKSTLLRSIAGLESIDSGEIRVGDRRVDGRAPADRGISLVFQNQAPYPHLSVAGNLAFGLRARRRPRSEIRDRVAEVASALGLDGLLDRRPATLSGGEKQRVALGRALATRPDLLLLDEPFSNLDGPLRASARDDLIRWQRRFGITTLIVTHDQAEALGIGDRVAVMDAGRVVQVGTPRDVYDRPADRVVARFVGNPPMNILPCERPIGDPGTFRVLGTEAGELATAARGLPDRSERVDLGIRAEAVELIDPALSGVREGRIRIASRVDRVEFRGDQAIATLRAGEIRLLARVDPRASMVPGGAVVAEIDPARAVFFDPRSGARVADRGPGA